MTRWNRPRSLAYSSACREVEHDDVKVEVHTDDESHGHGESGRPRRCNEIEMTTWNRSSSTALDLSERLHVRRRVICDAERTRRHR